MRKSLLSVFQACILVIFINIRWQNKGFNRPSTVNQFTKPNCTIVHIDFLFIFMLQCGPIKEIFLCKFNWELLSLSFLSLILELITKHFVGVNNMIMQTVSYAISTQWIISKSKAWLIANLEQLQHKKQEFIRKHLWKSCISKQKHNGMV